MNEQMKNLNNAFAPKAPPLSSYSYGNKKDSLYEKLDKHDEAIIKILGLLGDQQRAMQRLQKANEDVEEAIIELANSIEVKNER